MRANKQQLEFHGRTGEFFKIWIVNMMLSIVTLGIYSAWAKVRTRKYFYSNTLLMNSPFDYLADPIKILKGRLFTFALIFIYSISAIISPILQLVIMLIFIPLFPWIIIKSLKFNMYNSAYRNIRFHFKAEYLTALWVFVGLPILVAFSLGLAYPYFVRARKKFVIDHSAYGTTQFDMEATTGEFYGVYLKTLAVTILIGIFSTLIVYIIQSIIPFNLAAETKLLFPMLMAVMFYPLLMVIYGYLYTTITNLVFNQTQLGQYQFESNLETLKMCWLYFSNTLAIIFTLGLLIPWAMIRTARYRISCLSLISDQDAEAFIAAEAEKVDAVAEEMGDLMDIDFGL